MALRFYVQNFGCRATQADGAALEHDLRQRGFQPAAETTQADLVVLNTCTVTAAADEDARRAVRRIHRDNPGAQILVTGCYAQRAPREVAALPGVRWVVGNSHKVQIGSLLAPALGNGAKDPGPGLAQIGLAREITKVSPSCFVPLETLRVPSSKAPYHGNILVGDIFAEVQLLTHPVFGAGRDRTRPNLKIQDGCNNRCSFCVIPFVRGRSRSLAPEDVVEQVRGLVAAGYREVVLSGINLGRYGRDLAPSSASALALQAPSSASPIRASPIRASALALQASTTLPSILRRILEETTVERVRLSSVEPLDFTDELLELMASTPRVARHVHAPLQSGSARILRAMHRRYRPERYEERLLRAYALLPDAAFGADVMVGFPGETDRDFADTRALVERLPFTYLHVFTYSRREGTPAARLDGQVHGRVARERNRVLRDLAAAKNRAFRERQVGRVLSALTLEDGSALSSNYLRVRIEAEKPAPNQLVPVRVTELTADGLKGQVATSGLKEA